MGENECSCLADVASAALALFFDPGVCPPLCRIHVDQIGHARCGDRTIRRSGKLRAAEIVVAVAVELVERLVARVPFTQLDASVTTIDSTDARSHLLPASDYNGGSRTLEILH